MTAENVNFEITPKMGFFGIGKSKAHCFTAPKKTYPALKKLFDLSLSSLQRNAFILINSQQFPFVIRLVNMNRSKVRNLLPSRLSKREVIQFSWKTNPNTQEAVKTYLNDSFAAIIADNNAVVASVTFRQLSSNCFELISSNKDDNTIEITPSVEKHYFEVGKEYRDTGKPKNIIDEFMRRINIEGSGIRNAGGIRNLRSLRSGYSGLDGLILVTNHTSGNLHNLWKDKIIQSEKKLVYWGDAKFHSSKQVMDFQGNKYLKEASDNEIPILHFVRKRQSFVEFTGIYTLDTLEEREMEDRGEKIINLFAVLSKTSDEKVSSVWLKKWRVEDEWSKRIENAPEDWLSSVNKDITIHAENEVTSLKASVPSSFVQRKIKLADDRGNGISKLYIGPIKKKQMYQGFFQNWNPMNTYELDQVELLLYLQDVQEEFTKSGKYKAISRGLFYELVQRVENLSDNRIDLTPLFDKSRYYVRGSSEAWKLIRDTCLPLITNIKVEIKNKNEDGSCDFILRPFKTYTKKETDPNSGETVNLIQNKNDLQVGDEAIFEEGKIRIHAIDKRSGSNMQDVIIYSQLNKEGGSDGFIRTTEIDKFAEKSSLDAKKGAVTRKINSLKRKGIPNVLQERVWQRDQGMCQANYRLDTQFDKYTGDICESKEFLEYDHIVPFSKGGKTTFRNLQLLCRTHNRMKSDKEL